MTINPQHAILIGFLDGNLPLWEVGWMGSSLQLSPDETHTLLASLLRSGLVEVRSSSAPGFDFSEQPIPTEDALKIVSDPQEWVPQAERARPVEYWVDMTDEGLKRARALASALPEGYRLPWEERPIP